MTPSAEKDARRWFYLGAVICAAFGVVTLGTVVVALFSPPPWNRAERFLHAWAWLYVAALHLRLARAVPPERQEGS